MEKMEESLKNKAKDKEKNNKNNAKASQIEQKKMEKPPPAAKSNATITTSTPRSISSSTARSTSKSNSTTTTTSNKPTKLLNASKPSTDKKPTTKPTTKHTTKPTTKHTTKPTTKHTTKPTSKHTTTKPLTDNQASNFQKNKAHELHELIQHLYIAQARVQLEAIEIKKAQYVANTAQQSLEEAANHVRAITGALQSAQQEVASAAIRAQTAQLQLAAHDQLLFAARQDVDALSSQMVGLQAAEGISAPKISFDVANLLDKLKQPLPDSQKPTAIPAICTHDSQAKPKPKKSSNVDTEDYYENVYED